jgi:multidrug efflux system membrane fusion protein
MSAFEVRFLYNAGPPDTGLDTGNHSQSTPFMNTKPRNYPVLLSAAIAIGIVLWMLSGIGNDPEASSISETTAASSADEALQVRVQQFKATETTREILISGRTEPNRIVEMRAEAEGSVVSIGAERGEPVAEGAVLVKLDLRDRNAQLAEAAARVAQRELEFKAVENLRSREFTTDVQIADASAQLESARANHERIKLEIANTSLLAPIDAVLQDRTVEIGDFVRTGDTVAQLVDLDPLIVVGEVNERQIAELAVGSEGTARLVDGSEVSGTVRYLAAVADPGTRSFTVELAVPNPDNRIRAGQTAEIRLFADRIKVHTLSAALLSLADDGTVGVKVVDNDERVKFYPVDIAGSTPQGMQVTGLPDDIRLITVGQGFVTEGQRVDAVTVSSPEGAAAYERAD